MIAIYIFLGLSVVVSSFVVAACMLASQIDEREERVLLLSRRGDRD